MPLDCGLLCLFTERRRHIEVLWRRRLLVTDDERKAKRRFLNLMRGFDTEDLDVLRKAIESGGVNIKQCAPGPPMDLIEEREESSSEEEDAEPDVMPGCSTTIVSTRPRHSIKQMEKDRILFQRQRFPTVASIQHQSGGATTATITQQPLDSVGSYQRRYSTHKEQQQRNRRSSNFSRRLAVYTMDENGNALRPVTTTIVTARQSNSSSDAEMPPEPDTALPSTSRSTARRRGDDLAFTPRRDIADAAAALSSNPDAGLIPQIDKPMSMPYLCCKMWRWRDLQVDAALHRLDPLPWCRFGRVTINNATVSCCNPYHYGLWIKPETSSSDGQSISSGVLANGGRDEPSAIDLGDTTIGHVRTAFEHSVKATARTEAAEETPPGTPPPAPPITGNSSELMGNHLGAAATLANRRVSHSVHHQAMSWGRMARWQHGERVGDVVTLVGQFAVVGRLAGTVFDGQDVKTPWDLDNSASFALLRQSSDDMSETLDEVWLYNSSDLPLFLCISRNISRATSTAAIASSASGLVPSNIRRLSPGYCIRVHRVPAGAALAAELIGNDLAALGGTSSPTHHRYDHHHRSSTTADHHHAVAQPLSLLTISVGLGWGANYECRSVSQLPCRYEVIFT